VIAIGPQKADRDSGIIARMAARAVNTTGRARRTVASTIASRRLIPRRTSDSIWSTSSCSRGRLASREICFYRKSVHAVSAVPHPSLLRLPHWYSVTARWSLAYAQGFFAIDITLFAANAINLVTCWQISAADRLMLPLPLFHVHGLGNGLHSWLISGCRMRLLERFEHQKATESLLDFRPTLFFGVPTIYVRLLETPAGAAREIGSAMRLFVSGSAPLAAQVLEDFRALFGHTILERYGMSETLMNISNPYEGERRAGTVGFPMPGVSVRLLDPEGNRTRDGETGEIYLRGANVFSGYWNRPEATQEAFRDGWFRTGDLATLTPDGYYTLVGRRSDLIISGGFNIYPREIEEFLTEQPEIAEAAVVGVPDRLRGEMPVAYVVERSPFNSRDLEERCRAAMASYKVPRAFIQVEKLPRNAMGKIQKHLLPRTPA